MADAPGIATSHIATVADFLTIVNGVYKRPLLAQGEKGKWVMQTPRFSSGIVSLDEALGGGWPYGRLALLAGEYSTGKTEIAINAMKSIQEYDHDLRVHRLLLPEGKKFNKGRVLWIDAENAFDKEWAAKKGVDVDYHVFARTETAQEAIDIIKVACNQNLFDLIVLDSIAQMVPQEELEASSTEWQMGLAARLLNKAYRVWNGTLAKRASNKAGGGPAVIAMNHIRFKICAAAQFGDPRVLPGGQQQTFCSSIIIYTRAPTYNSKEAAEMVKVELAGNLYKNKTATPRQNYSFSLQLKTDSELKAGEVDNCSQLVKRGKELNLITKNTDTGYTFAGTTYRTLDEIIIASRNNEVLRLKLWRSVITVATGFKA